MDAYLSVAMGYAELAKWWVDAWAAQLRKVASAASSPSHSADQCTTDVVSTGFLAAESMFRLVNEGMEAMETMAAGDRPKRITLPQTFYTDAGPSSKLPRDLALEGPLRNESKERPDQLPKDSVTIEPRHLDPGVTSFQVHANATGRERGAYRGTIIVSGPTVPGRVDIVIPV